jgi:peptidoglycan/LPS O-acetylase OafA/YrhL
VSANFLAVYHLRGAVSRWLVQNKRLFGIAASNTLSLYLYHYPVVVLLQHLGVANWTGIALTIAACLALAPFTEHRRYRLRQAMCGAVTRTRARLKLGKLRLSGSSA